MDVYEAKRNEMVDALIEEGVISKKEVIDAMRAVPRHLFVPDDIKHLAYVDSPQQIGEGQTISAPHMVGIMAEWLELAPGQKVLEIGAGFGYHAAVIARIIGRIEPETNTGGGGTSKRGISRGHVYTIEYVKSLASQAAKNIERAGLSNIVTVINADGSGGLPEEAPYDRIFVACAAPSIPAPLVEQLDEGGILLIPVGKQGYQDLIQCKKKGGELIKKSVCGCVFVPLVGEYGVR